MCTGRFRVETWVGNPLSCTQGRSNEGMQVTASSVRSVRRESGMEACGNTSGIQVPDAPLELSPIDHSMV
jgi:hypothetical protein